jgi:hypothetical protein
MQPDREIHATIFNFLREEFNSIQSALGSGELRSFRDKVDLSWKINGVMHALGPLVRSDIRARLLVRRAERLKRDLLSSRAYTEQRIPASLLRQIFAPPVHRGGPGT